MTHAKSSDLNSVFDIHVDGKFEQIVFISANAKGRKAVEKQWPDVMWSRDERFSALAPADWLFTHIRVTRLPSHLEAQIPLSFANPDSLGFAVAGALHVRIWPLRVGLTGADHRQAKGESDSFGWQRR